MSKADIKTNAFYDWFTGKKFPGWVDIDGDGEEAVIDGTYTFEQVEIIYNEMKARQES